MKSLGKIFAYVLKDSLLSRWNIAYFIFFLVSTLSLIHFSGLMSKAMVSLLNIVVLVVPLMSTIIGSMYYYNARDFVTLLLAQPISRRKVFLGTFLGLSISLTASVVLSIFVGFLYGAIVLGQPFGEYIVLLVVSAFLSMIFCGISFYISAANKDKVKGMGYALFLWMLMAILYDGFFLLWLIIFGDYPVENHALVFALFNPIDLSRTLVMLNLDFAAMMGYTGAVFKTFFGAGWGRMAAFGMLVLWLVGPIFFMLRSTRKKDF